MRAHRVRAREPHPQVGVEEDHAVADAGRVLELVVVLAERELPSAIIAAKRSNVDEVELLELAEAAPEGRRRLPGDHRDHRPAWRTGMHCTWARSLDAEQRRIALDDLAGARKRTGDERPRRPRRPPRRRGPPGRASGRWSAAPGRGRRSGARPPPPPARAAGGRRSTGRRAPATTPRAAGRDAAISPRARSWCAPARRTWSRRDRTGGTGGEERFTDANQRWAQVPRVRSICGTTPMSTRS